MFIWTAINVNDQLLSLKDDVKVIEGMVKYNESNTNLPLHISLKISSKVDDNIAKKVIKDLKLLLKRTKPFPIKIEGIELHETICWVKIHESRYLNRLHKRICHLFNDKYNIPLHEFDKAFKYHITLFLDHDEAKVKEGFMHIKDSLLPKTLIASSFVIGSSPEGKIGTYTVNKEIKHFKTLR
jgi:2'-5' RNA ligase